MQNQIISNSYEVQNPSPTVYGFPSLFVSLTTGAFGYGSLQSVNYTIIFFSLQTLFNLLIFTLFPFILLKIFVTDTEEDLYHSKHNKEDGGKIILKVINNQTSIEKIKIKLRLLDECYNKNSITKNHIQNRNTNWEFTDADKYNELDDNYHYKLLKNSNDNIIYANFKHKYIGGAYIRDLLLSLVITEQTPSKQFYPHSSFINFFYFLKLLYNYNTIPKITGVVLNLVNSKTDIQRYINTYDIDRNDNNKHSSRIIIIFNALKTIQQTLNLGRPLVCYLPIAFNHIYGVSNNIGIMFIELLENDTIDTFNKRFERNKYQALATNFILLNNLHKLSISNGSSIRQSVDIVLTSIYFNCDESEKESMLYWSYENIAEYPIYIAISSCVMKEKIVVSQTITSNIGKINLPLDYKEIDYDYFIPK